MKKMSSVNYVVAVSGNEFTLLKDIDGKMNPVISGSSAEVKDYIEKSLPGVEVGYMGDGRRKRRTSIKKLAIQLKRSGHVRIRKDLLEKLMVVAEMDLETDVVTVARGAFYEVMKKEVA